MRARELIATHSNTDFDAFAAMVAARKLYPEARLVLSGSVNRNVREFQALYADLVPVTEPADLELDAVERLVLVDTVHPNRIGDLAALCERPGVQVVAFDHHALDEEVPAFIAPENLVSAPTGALVTLLVRIIAERGIPVTPFEASLFAIGIHEDTGSLTFSTTTVADAEALAFCMRHGADPALLEKWLTNALSDGQRRTLARALERAEDLGIEGVDAYLSALHEDLYVEGVSVVAHRFMDLTGCDAFFLLVEMEHRIFVTARSRGGRLDVAEALAAVGGGGHPAAASAVVKDRPMDDVKELLKSAAAGAVRPVAVAGDALRPGLFETAIEDTVDAAALACRHLGVDGLAVVDDGVLVGMVALTDLDRAVAHGLGHAPVKAVMISRVPAVSRDKTLDDAALVIAQQPIGWVPVIGRADDGRPVLREDVLGMLGRADVAGGRAGADEHAVEPAGNLAGRLAGLSLDDVLAHVQAVAADVRGVYLVGGAVRDLLLGETSFDIDLAVEGDGIAFARALAGRLRGHVRPHDKFGTAVVVAPAPARPGGVLRVDVASTRSESYDYPAALPKVEHADIRSDLARRDFTINAMAVSLKPESFGALLDFFGGRGDLEARRVVVLHNLSFIEDPTRILRAVRYESRYGLRMDEHTLNLALACGAMDLIGDLSSARLRDELLALLDEEKVDFALRRLDQLGVTASIHARLRAGGEERALIRRSDELRAAHGVEAEAPAWRVRLVWLLRELSPEEIVAWAGRMRIKRRDAAVLGRALVVGQRLVERVSRGPTEAELDEVARGEPVEALLAAMTLDASGASAVRLGHYLDVTRHVRLEIGGRDLLGLGFASSPRMGDVLRSVLRLKLNGLLAGREQELAAAARLREEGEPPVG